VEGNSQGKAEMNQGQRQERSRIGTVVLDDGEGVCYVDSTTCTVRSRVRTQPVLGFLFPNPAALPFESSLILSDVLLPGKTPSPGGIWLLLTGSLPYGDRPRCMEGPCSYPVGQEPIHRLPKSLLSMCKEGDGKDYSHRRTLIPR